MIATFRRFMSVRKAKSGPKLARDAPNWMLLRRNIATDSSGATAATAELEGVGPRSKTAPWPSLGSHQGFVQHRIAGMRHAGACLGETISQAPLTGYHSAA